MLKQKKAVPVDASEVEQKDAKKTELPSIDALMAQAEAAKADAAEKERIATEKKQKREQEQERRDSCCGW